MPQFQKVSDPEQVVRLQLMFVRQGMALAVIGVTLGVVGATMLTRLMASLLFGTSPLDPSASSSVATVSPTTR